MKTFSIIFVSLFLIVSSLPAQVPQLINYQGKLDSSGVPISGPRNLTFNIYSVATGGTSLWTEIQSGVTVTNGIFNVLLGSVTTFPATVFGGTGDRYLGVTVGTGTEMSPRYRITSAAFSIRAANADGVADNSVTTTKIADNNVTAAKVLDEPGVTHKASIPMNNYRGIPSGTTALDSITINVPAAGYVLVFGSLSVCISHTIGTEDEAYFQLMNTRGTIDFSQTGFGQIRVPSELPTNTLMSTNYNQFINISRVFTVGAAGAFNFYLNTRVQQGWDVNDGFINAQMSAIYFPTNYGTVSLNLQTQENTNESAGE